MTFISCLVLVLCDMIASVRYNAAVDVCELPSLPDMVIASLSWYYKIIINKGCARYALTGVQA